MIDLTQWFYKGLAIGLNSMCFMMGLLAPYMMIGLAMFSVYKAITQ